MLFVEKTQVKRPERVVTVSLVGRFRFGATMDGAAASGFTYDAPQYFDFANGESEDPGHVEKYFGECLCVPVKMPCDLEKFGAI